MNKETYDKKVQELTEDRKGVSSSKRKDYTRGDEDVLKNFKNQAEYMGITPLQSLGVHMEKQFAAVMNYIKTDGKSESEPIIRRIGDVMNYLELLWGLLHDLGYLDDEEDNTDWEEEYVYTNGIIDAIRNDEFNHWKISNKWTQEQEKAIHQNFANICLYGSPTGNSHKNKSTLEDKKTSELKSENNGNTSWKKEHRKIDIDEIFSYKPEDSYFSFYSNSKARHFHGTLVKGTDNKLYLETRNKINEGDYLTLSFNRNEYKDVFILRCEKKISHEVFSKDYVYKLDIVAFRRELNE